MLKKLDVYPKSKNGVFMLMIKNNKSAYAFHKSQSSSEIERLLDQVQYECMKGNRTSILLSYYKKAKERKIHFVEAY